jgi:hypothetical protein
MDTATWSKVFEQDLSALKNVTDGQVASKDGLEGQGSRDVDALLKGRQI